MSNSFITRADDFEVGMFLTVLAPPCSLFGTVLQVKCIDLPLIIVKMFTNHYGEHINIPLFAVDYRDLEFKKLSEDAVKVLAPHAFGKPANQTSEGRSIPIEVKSGKSRKRHKTVEKQ